ncbi:MAG: hypothetical protein JOY62_01250 [Acidobacteriaceae bacterium]|nr:hypothetical protein [Acidobacteriaceae bacterium]
MSPPPVRSAPAYRPAPASRPRETNKANKGSGNTNRGNLPSAGTPSNVVNGGRQPSATSKTVPQPSTYTSPGRLPSTNSSPGVDSSGFKTTATAARAGILNGRPLPPGEVVKNKDGSSALRTKDGRQYVLGPNGHLDTFRGTNNTEARFRPDGSVHTVHANGMTITHGPGGVRHIIAERPDHTVVVSSSARHGYVQRQFTAGNQQFVQRTHYFNGVSYTRVYQSYYYRGVLLERYVPISYYSPAFYGWLYSPWPAPISYGWGWAGNPWYVYYGWYFEPFPVYPNASLWLTDYILSTSLTQAYQERVDAAASNSQANPGPSDAATTRQGALTPEVKQVVADEVQRQLALEKADAEAAARNATVDAGSEAIPQTLNDNAAHAFVVSTALEVSTSQGQDCAVTEGDVLQLSGPPPVNSAAAEVKVLASKDQDCRQGTLVTVSFQDLQDMQNHMREVIDQGMGQLQAHQGGLPAPPAGASGQIQSSFASAVPPADPNVAAELKRQVHTANLTEEQVVSQATAPETGTAGGVLVVSSPSPVTISLGQTIDQVVASLGNPKQIVNLGAKQIYVYSDMKVIFANGRVSDVQ